MATFPSYVRIGLSGIGEQHTPIVQRTEMERGIPKQRRIAADALVKMPMTLYFDSRADAESFENWFYGGEGMGWFDLVHPRSRLKVSARIVGGDIGTSTPSNQTWSYSERQVAVEYVRPSL